MRTGSPWRDLPAELGDWRSTYTRFKRWGESARRQMILDVLSGDKNWEVSMIAITVVRVRQHAAGAPKKPDTRKSGDRVVGGAPGFMRWLML